MGSNPSIDHLTPTKSNPYPQVRNVVDIPTPSSTSVPILGYVSPPAYSDPVGSYAYPRSRRKSLSHVQAPTPTESETSEEDPYLANVHGHTKSKRRHTRGGSFSLPFHRRRRTSNAIWPRWLVPHKRQYTPGRKIFALLIAVVIALMYSYNLFHKFFEFQFEVSIFPKRWVRAQVDDIQPLRGCFDSHQMSPEYSETRHDPFRQLLAPGIPMRRGMQCYDFSSTIQPIPVSDLRHVTYHTYWRSDLIAFGERQTATLTAFLATQPLTHSKLILWTNGADSVKANEYVRPFLEKWGNYMEIRQVDMTALTKGTELEGVLSTIDGGGLFDERAWVDGDAVRLLVLWQHGGVWMDMDQILTRDLHPLTDAEFVTQWDCYGEPTSSFLLMFRQTPLRPQRCPDALPPPLSLSVRSLPHHGIVTSPQTQHLHLGLPPLLQAPPSPRRSSYQTIHHPPVVFRGS